MSLAATIWFEDNSLLPELFGPHTERLKRLARLYEVSLDHRGNAVVCRGEQENCERARTHLEGLYERLKRCETLREEDFGHTKHESEDSEEVKEITEELVLELPKATIFPRNSKQRQFLQALDKKFLVFALGPAGTGKTCIALCYGLSLLLRGDIERLVLSRPVVEAGEHLGFLPGDMREKVDPYLRPIFDLLHKVLGKQSTERLITRGAIEIAPLAFMRGRTLENAFLLLDEAQNTSPQQMKMFLTRLGEGSRMAITGDPGQADIPSGKNNGLLDAEKRLAHLATFVRFSAREVLRHPLVAEVLRAYGEG